MKSTAAAVLGLALAAVTGLVGCTNEEAEPEGDSTAAASVEQESSTTERGARLFFKETFKGNGRTCGTCHGEDTGTINPTEVTKRFARDPKDPLFKHDGADTLGGKTFERIKKHATIIVNVPMHANVSLVGSNSRTAQLNRGVPSTMNIALDPVLMLDGRDPTLEIQAKGAILGHAQSANVTARQLADIAAFEKTLFNRKALKHFARGGAAPTLPEGNTEAQKRGRVFFTDDFVQVNNGTAFRCVHCHSGPMLNETSPAFEVLFGAPKGTRFFNIAVAEFNTIGNPVREYDFKLPNGTTQRVASADPGRALVTGNVADVGAFKILTVWGAKHTAPYFHNNAAKNLPELVKHYQILAPNIAPPLAFTDAHAADMLAYLELL